MSKILGIDYGEKNIGIAISDSAGIFARPHSVINNDDFEAIKKIVREQGIEKIVLGLPYSLSGQESEKSKQVIEFKKKLEEQVNLLVELWDERFSTSSAESYLIEGHVRRKERKKVIDKVAAAIILQNYLDSKKRP